MRVTSDSVQYVQTKKPVRFQKPVVVDPGVKKVYGHPFADVGPTRTPAPPEFPDLCTPADDRRGFGLMRFKNSRLVELEGYGDLEKARALLKPMGLEPVATPSGKARVSIGTMSYKFFAGLFQPNEIWLAIQAKPIEGGKVGQAYIYTLTDSAMMKHIGEGFGIPYERGALQITDSGYAPDAVTIHDAAGRAYAGMKISTDSGMWLRAYNRVVDFPSYSPTPGKSMEVHIEGRAAARPFDPEHDQADFGAKTEIGKVTTALDFSPQRWITQDGAKGAIRSV